MLPSKLQSKLAIGSYVFLAALLCWYFQDIVRTNGYAVSVKPENVRPETSETQILIIKNADASGNTLLLQSTDRPQFFLYDPSKKSIEKSDWTAWKSSQERELDCWEQSTYDDYSGPSYGYYIFAAKKSPDGSKIAVLSAYGPKLPDTNGMFFGGTGLTLGTRYLEIRNTSGNELFGKPVRIDISSRVLKPRLCWSDRARYVIVYADERETVGKVSIIDVP